MMLSVIIISYNEAEYLPGAIESCLTQNFSGDYEIIIGDDGSSDESLSIIQKYEEKYPNKIRHFVMERGDEADIIASVRVSNVIKRGLDDASGKYITILSGDDCFCDNTKFQRSVDFLERRENISIYSAYATAYKQFWNNGEEKTELLMLQKRKLPSVLLWGCWYIHLSCFVFRKFAPELLLKRFCDDDGMAYSILRRGKVFYDPVVAFAYRQREKSIMHEADTFEFHIMRGLLAQDYLNAREMRIASLARMAGDMQALFSMRDKLKAEKYTKYLLNAQHYDHNYLRLMRDYDRGGLVNKCKVRWILLVSQISYWYLFFFVRKMYFKLLSS